MTDDNHHQDKVLPTNSLVRALLTDLYQLTMTYAHWKTGKADEFAVFELFFRKNPFKGGYTVFCGLDECLKLLQTFRFTPDDIAYLQSTDALSHCEPGFFDYLSNIHCNSMASLKVRSVPEGTIVFPRCPLMTIEGPLGIGHLLETTLLNLINYPSLVATNASRMVQRANSIPCIEFGLRRAQGPDGACSASKYSYVGGFVGTSNVMAGKVFGIPIAGTHAHSYVQSFTSLDDAAGQTLWNKHSLQDEDFLEAVLEHRGTATTNDGELAAFCNYACAFPNSCLCLIDTYDTLNSGLVNFVCVAKALDDFGYVPKGVRLDSGDLVSLSNSCKAAFDKVLQKEPDRTNAFANLTIVASNDINEAVLEKFANTKHSLTAFGIGTNLVTCQAQPALGCVYKLVECKGEPRIKLSEEIVKVTLPGRKRIYRLYGGPNGTTPLLDYMTLADEEPPSPSPSSSSCCGDDQNDSKDNNDKNENENNGGILCRDPFRQQHRLRVFPKKVKPLQSLVFDGGKGVVLQNEENETKETSSITSNTNLLSLARDYLNQQLSEEFSDEITKYENPTKYDIMVSPKLYAYLHELWEKNAPVPTRR